MFVKLLLHNVVEVEKLYIFQKNNNKNLFLASLAVFVKDFGL